MHEPRPRARVWALLRAPLRARAAGAAPRILGERVQRPPLPALLVPLARRRCARRRRVVQRGLERRQHARLCRRRLGARVLAQEPPYLYRVEFAEADLA